jgi:hypothetical protein
MEIDVQFGETQFGSHRGSYIGFKEDVVVMSAEEVRALVD